MSDDAVLDTGQLPTASSLKEFFENSSIFGGFIPYLQANEDLIPVLEKLVENSKSYESLKSNMLAFIQDRKNFVEAANNNLP